MYKNKDSFGKSGPTSRKNCLPDDRKQKPSEETEEISDKCVENLTENKDESFLDSLSDENTRKIPWYNKVSMAGGAVFFIALISWGLTFSYSENVNNKMNQENVEVTNQMNELFSSWRNKYPNQENETWDTIEAQIENFLQKSYYSPLVITFIHNDAAHTAELLAWEISSGAVKLKHNGDECGDTNIYTLNGNDSFIKKDYLLKNQLIQIGKCKKLVVQNFEKFSPKAVPDLVSLLDPDFPNVPSAVYIFLLDVSQNFEKRLSASAQTFMTKLWKRELDEDMINPVLSRLDNYVKIVHE